MDSIAAAALPRRFFLTTGRDGADAVAYGVRWPDGSVTVHRPGAGAATYADLARARESAPDARAVWLDRDPGAAVRAGYVTFTRQVGAGVR